MSQRVSKQLSLKQNFLKNKLAKYDNANFNQNDMISYLNEHSPFYDELNVVLQRLWPNINVYEMKVFKKNQPIRIKPNIQRYMFVKAFTHKSYFKDKPDERFYFNYERLEFVGDAHLNYLLNRWVFHEFSQYGEKIMSKVYAYLKSTKFLSQVFDALKLQPLVRKHNECELTDKLKEDMVESFIHAFYCNFGESMTKVLINKFMAYFDKNNILYSCVDFYSMLNEMWYEKYGGLDEFQGYSMKDCVLFNVKQNRKLPRHKQWICFGYSINGYEYRNRWRVNCSSKRDLLEKMAESILVLGLL